MSLILDLFFVWAMVFFMFSVGVAAVTAIAQIVDLIVYGASYRRVALFLFATLWIAACFLALSILN